MERGRAAQAADLAQSGAQVAHADDFADLDRRLVLATQGGLPLVPRPFSCGTRASRPRSLRLLQRKHLQQCILEPLVKTR